MGYFLVIRFSNFTLVSLLTGDLDFPGLEVTEVQCYFNPSGIHSFDDVDTNDCNRPVLKHGPRSLTYVRVFEWLKLRGAMKVKAFVERLRCLPCNLLQATASTDHFFLKEI